MYLSECSLVAIAFGSRRTLQTYLAGSFRDPGLRCSSRQQRSAITPARATESYGQGVRPSATRGFTGLHAHANLGTDGFRTVLLNGLAWVTKLEIPEGGVPSKVSPKELQTLIEEAKATVAAGH